MTSRRFTVPALAVSALVLAGCASPGANADDDGALRIVASTGVYGDIAAAIGGDLVEVTSIVTSLSQDPHSYEASARDQLTISRADLIIRNGGGYDAFVDALIEASGTDAGILTAVEFSHDFPGAGGHGHDDADDHDHADDDHADADADADADHDHDRADDDHADDDHADADHADDGHDGHADADHDHIEGFNEHVWYDPHTIAHLAEEIAHELGELDPDGAATYEANAAAFLAGIDEIEAALDEIAAQHEGAQVFVTEPVPVYLITAAGLIDATPPAFSEAVEEGQDVPPATLLEALRALTSGEIHTVIANAQTGGAETTQVIETAREQGIPVLEFTELVPEGETYLTWMRQNVVDLASTLTR